MQPRYPQIKHQLWTKIFTADARRILAEDVLIVAERVNGRALTTGHLLIAILESPDDRASEIIVRAAATGRRCRAGNGRR